MNSRTLHHPSYSPNYFSLDDILATNEKLPCKFDRAVISMGFLDPSARSKDLEKGLKLELPLWMASALGSRRKIVSCSLPRAFNDRYKDILRADASLVDLHALSPYYYELGRHLLPLVGAEGATLGTHLISTLKKRLRGIMDNSLNCQEAETLSRKSHFDHLERRLFQTGRSIYQDHQLWLQRRTHLLHTVPTAPQQGKRKISEIS
ncbi:DNA replication complex GINS protein PSF3 [Chionoecetes opilio]|uniref:DNA replication complex GINS protein PSF3 n=1 Tax=Chionoecetes opilio TaxID=41210 RepID=A0A8J5CJV7_CHIOP|nr:DNA replication complex GINS protein PSF3 [Chionoecetes opilio]